MIRSILFAVLLLTSTNTNHVDLAYFDSTFQYSQCSTPSDDIVHIKYNRQPIKSVMDYAFASRNKKTKQQEIVLNFNTFGTAPSDVREWVFYHECGHHRLGHTTTMGYFTVSDEDLIEGEATADCFAVQEFRTHHSEHELGRAMHWLHTQLQMSSTRIKRLSMCQL